MAIKWALSIQQAKKAAYTATHLTSIKQNKKKVNSTSDARLRFL
jgi:hypothetical protein